MPDGKYVVFKSESLDNLLLAFGTRLTAATGEALNNFVSSELPDAVVIRRQDVFSPPAFDAYANSILAAVEMVESLDGVDQAQVKGLRDIADYFHEQAVAAWNTNRKLPD